MSDQSNRGEIALVLGFGGLVGLVLAAVVAAGDCGSKHTEDQKLPAVSSQIQKACDTDTGNLVYWAEGAGVQVVVGGCKWAQKTTTPASTLPPGAGVLK